MISTFTLTRKWVPGYGTYTKDKFNLGETAKAHCMEFDHNFNPFTVLQIFQLTI